MAKKSNLGKVEANSIQINLSAAVENVLIETGKHNVALIKEGAPVGASGKYADGWTSKLTDKNKSVTIYNDGEHKSLSHLLENGHLAKDGKFMPPQEHIQPAFNQTKAKYESDLKHAALEEIHHATKNTKKIN